MLELQNLSRHFGGVKAVDELDLSVRKGEILGLIGPNGSGKSTTVNLITGVYKPTTGSVTFKGHEISQLDPHQRTEAGSARTFQNSRLFGHLTVWQNLWAARVVREQGWAGFKQRWLSGASAAREQAEQLLVFGDLAHKRDMLAGMPRAQALRQLSRRIKLPAMTSFTSALIQAEALGASVAETLQLQALDMRQRRKEDALPRAQALPVKLVFPLVICVLPGIFLSTLAPVMLQMVQVAGGVLRSGQ